MRICYNVTIEDVVAFNRYHFEHSRSLRWNRIGWTWLVPFLVLCMTAGMVAETEEPLVLVAGVLIALCLAFLMSRVVRWSFDHQVRKMLKEGKNKGMFGPQELELTDGELVVKSPFAESRVSLEVIERLVCRDDYSFIYLSAVTGLAIRHSAVSEGDYEEFIETVRQKIALQA